MRRLVIVAVSGLVCVGLVACGGMQARTDETLKQAAKDLRGMETAQLLICAGLPDATVALPDEKQVLSYIRKTTRIHADYFPYFYASCGYPFYRRACHGWVSAYMHFDSFDVVERGCRVAFWIEGDKVSEVSFEASSKQARSYGAKIVRPCLDFDEIANGSPSPAQSPTQSPTETTTQ